MIIGKNNLETEVYKNPHPKGWGYTDKARLRGLIRRLETTGFGIRQGLSLV